MKKSAFIVLLLISPWSVLGNEALERELAGSQGAQRLALLVELSTEERLGEPTRALRFGAEAHLLLESYPDETLALQLNNTLAIAHYRLGEYREALPLTKQGVDMARQQDDQEQLALALRYLGKSYRQLNRYRRAATASAEAHELYKTLGKERWAAHAANEAGIAYSRLGDYTQALSYYLRTLAGYEQIGNTRGVARLRNNLGIVYRKLGQYDKAVELYQQALAAQREAGSESAVARTLNNLGVAYRQLGDLDRALEHYFESIEIKRRVGDRAGIGASLNNVGFVYKEKGELDRAFESYQESLAIKEEVGDRRGQVATQLEMAVVHRLRGNPEAGLARLALALEIATEIQAKESIMNVERERANCLAEAGRFEEALATFRRASELENEIFSEENARRIHELQAFFEADERDREIEILQQQQEIAALQLENQRKARHALAGFVTLLLVLFGVLYNRYRLSQKAKQLVSEKNDRLAKMVDELEERGKILESFTHTVTHDLKSPLVTIKGFAGFVEADIRCGEEERALADLGQITKAAGQMAQLLDDLLAMAHAGRVSNEPQEIVLSEIVDEVVERLAGRLAETGAEVIVHALPAAWGDPERIAAVYQNLIDNAAKFCADQEESRIDVGYNQQDGENIFFVRDNGIGIEPGDQDKVFEIFERLDASREGTGVGLALAKRVIEAHDGRIWAESLGKNQGTSFYFTLAAGPSQV